jgi:HEAT repeat protein
MRHATLVLAIGVLLAGGSRADAAGFTPGVGWLVGPAASGEPAIIAPAEHTDDPAYSDYREGYRLILDERWAEARRTFERLLRTYKQSAYRDDAAYWMAYAMKHLDARKAAGAYREFFKNYPGSSYLDDAVADYAELQVGPITSAQPLDSIEIRVDIPPAPGLPPDLPASVRVMTYNVRKLERTLRREMDPVRVMVYTQSTPRQLRERLRHETSDRATDVRVEALVALGKQADDSSVVNTLRHIALDRHEPVPMRQVALYSLSRSRKPETMPVFVQVATSDTNDELRSSAVFCIAEAGKNNPNSVRVLREIYETLPHHEVEQRVNVLDVIGTTGDAHALDFLVSVARSNTDPEVTAAAIEGIGETRAGRAKAVEALTSLYRSLPRERSDERGVVLYTIAGVGDDHAVEFLGTVATQDEEPWVRSDAIYLLGTIGGEKARSTLVRLLKSE